MIKIQDIKGKIKSRLGELWWYTLVLFVMQRFGDMINAFIGLWLVPKYVPQAELGALLPLIQVGGVIGYPISALALAFSKYINVFTTRGEYGKVKRLLRDAFCLSILISVVTICFAQICLPFVFERVRVEDGRLGLLVVISGVVGNIAIFFSSALQALKLFTMGSFIGFVSAPVRLIVLMICLPIRALSGYFVGQIVPVGCGILASLFVLRDFLFNPKIKMESYLKSDGRDMLRFFAVVFIGGLFALPQGFVEPFVIRHRLPDVESAAYYMISRFAEIGAYVGMSMSFILFPLASEQHARGSQSQRLVLNAISGSLISGVGLACFYYFFGEYLVMLLPGGVVYLPYISQLSALTVIVSMRSSINVFMVNEGAHQRYGVYWWNGLLVAIESLFLYVITGFGFFETWVPVTWVKWVAAIKPSRLDFVLWVMFVYSLVWLFYMSAQLFFQRQERRKVFLSCMTSTTVMS